MMVIKIYLSFNNINSKQNLIESNDIWNNSELDGYIETSKINHIGANTIAFDGKVFKYYNRLNKSKNKKQLIYKCIHYKKW